jgi:pyruvate decarboxylase
MDGWSVPACPPPNRPATVPLPPPPHRPVYINIACNVAGLPHPTFEREPIPFSLAPKHSNAHSLQLAVDTAVELLAGAVKPVLVGGVKLRPRECQATFAALAAACKYAVAIMPNAKGMVDETTERYIGVYWGQVSTPYCAETVEAADVAIFAGPLFNDYTTVGNSLLLKKEKMILVEPDRVVIANRRFFQCVQAADFMTALAARIPPNETAFKNHARMYVPAGQINKPAPDAPLVTKVAFQHIQQLIDRTPAALVVESGDSWFNGLRLKLPSGTPYEFQCQYGSIGWSVGATLGAAAAHEGGDRRVVAIIGDGSLQMTVQDVSTMLRYGLPPIIFVANNNGLTIEVGECVRFVFG